MPKWMVILYLALFAYLMVSEFFAKKRRRREIAEREQYAYCLCGQRMSEWFVNEGLMYHPAGFGCGWISPWTDHEDFRENRDIGEAKIHVAGIYMSTAMGREPIQESGIRRIR